MNSTELVAVALAVYLLGCGAVAGLGVVCEVGCEESGACLDEHDGEEGDCLKELTPVNVTNVNLAEQVCESASTLCSSDWIVYNVSNALLCRPDVVSVSYFHFSHEMYTVEVYWRYNTSLCSYLDNLVGVQVGLEGDGLSCLASDGSTDVGCCYCIGSAQVGTVGTDHDREGRYNITVAYANSQPVTVKVVSFPKLDNDQDFDRYTTTYDFDMLSNCYDPRLPADLDHCGIPMYSEPTNLKINNPMSKLDTDIYEATISWDPPLTDHDYPNPTDYYVRVQANKSVDFKVTDGTVLTLTNLSSSTVYVVYVRAYRRCSGVAETSSWRRGCGPTASTTLAYMDPTPVQPGNSMSDSAAVGIAVGVCVSVLSLVVAAVAVTVCLFIFYKRKSQISLLDPGSKVRIREGLCVPSNNIAIQPREQDLFEPPPDGALHPTCPQIHERLCTPTDNVPTPPIKQASLTLSSRNPHTGEPENCSSPIEEGHSSVLVVYSDRSHEMEKAEILRTLIGALRQERGIKSTCHDYFLRGDSMVFQIADTLQQAGAVLCICNPAFYADWNSEQPPPVINALKQMIGAEIMSGGNLSKYATVFMYDQDRRTCIPRGFLQNTRQFLISDVEGIVGFVKNVPSIEVVPIGK